MKSARVLRCSVIVFLGLAMPGHLLSAQPKSNPPAKAQPKKPAANKTPAKTPPSKSAGKSADLEPDAKSLQAWKALDVRRRKLHGRLTDLQSEFKVSSRVRKLEIKQEFDRLLREWKTEIQPKMVKLSLAKLAADPDGELASRLAEEHPDQRMVAKVTARLIQAGKNGGPILRLAGMASFNVNQFQRAAELLEQARDKNARLDNAIIDIARDYVKFWKKESDLRKSEAAAAAMPEKRLPRVAFETSKGTIVVELFENEAPNTVANFLTLVEKKFYDGQHFYNAKPLRSIEAGDPKTKPSFNSKLLYGFGVPVHTIKNESTGPNARMHFRGSLSMMIDDKESDGTMFALLRGPQPNWNPGAGGLGGQTVFGRVVEGMDVVDKLENGDKIVKATVRNKRPHPYKAKTSLDKDEPAKPDTAKKSKFPKTKAEPREKSKTDSKTKAPAFPKAKAKAEPKSTTKPKAPAKGKE